MLLFGELVPVAIRTAVSPDRPKEGPGIVASISDGNPFWMDSHQIGRPFPNARVLKAAGARRTFDALSEMQGN